MSTNRLGSTSSVSSSKSKLGSNPTTTTVPSIRLGSTSSVASTSSLEETTPSAELIAESSWEYVTHVLKPKHGKEKSRSLKRKTLGIPPPKRKSQAAKRWFASVSDAVGAQGGSSHQVLSSSRRRWEIIKERALERGIRPRLDSVISAEEEKLEVIFDDFDYHQTRGHSFVGDPSIASPPTEDPNQPPPAVASSWERWWVTSPFWKRKLLMLCILFFLITLMQFAMAMFCFGTAHREKVDDPLLCTTENCRNLADWISSSRDESYSPCEDFYNFSCGRHRRKDVGALYPHWKDNIMRLESDGENGHSMVAQLLDKLGNVDGRMGTKMIQYYKVCLRRWHGEDENELQDMLNFAVEYVFGKDLKIEKKPFQPSEVKFELETLMSRIPKVLGDSAFVRVLPPISPPFVQVEFFMWTAYMKAGNIFRFLPMILNALKITNPRDRFIIINNVYFMGAKHHVFMEYPHKCVCQKPGGDQVDFCKPNVERDFRFDLPFHIAYLGKEEGLNPKPEDKLKFAYNPIGGEQMKKNIANFEPCWNYYIRTRFNSEKNPHWYYYQKASYLTFWSLRLLIEVSHEVTDKTAEKYGMGDVSNRFFHAFQTRFYRREPESRCLESLLDSTGFYPLFRFQKGHNGTRYDKREALTVITHARDALKDAFRPAEVGGLRHVSSRYRERILRTLTTNDISIIVPYKEDDTSFPGDPTKVQMSSSHIQNVFVWREFLTSRTHHYFRSNIGRKSFGQLIWHPSFYNADKTVVYVRPSTSSDHHVIQFPPAMFVPPFWRNDLALANYAGAHLIAAKGWLKLIQADYDDHNVDVEIDHRRGAIPPVEFDEGVASDGDFTPCRTVTHGWFHPEDMPSPKTYLWDNTRWDPHFSTFRFGSRTYSDARLQENVKFGNQGFLTSLPARVMLKKYHEEVEGMRLKAFWYFDVKTRGALFKVRLKHYEEYTQAQLFFMVAFRGLCRSSTNAGNSPYFHHHGTENNAGLMHMRDFAEIWFCPKAHPMNPIDQCFESERDEYHGRYGGTL